MGSRRSTVTTTTTTVVYRAPSPPPAQQVITAGNVSSVPALTQIGSTRIALPPPDLPAAAIRYASPPTAWTSVPFVPSAPPALLAVASPTISENAFSSNNIAAAQDARDAVCDAILNDPSTGVQDFVVTGTGSSGVRFRFPVRGAPSGVTVVNLTTGATLAESDYTVTPRADSFAWILFTVALTDGVNYRITFSVGDSGSISSINPTSWRQWISQVSTIESNLNELKRATTGATSTARYVNSNSNLSWGITDPTQVDDALQAVRDFKRALKRPGMRVDINEISRICDYLNNQLQRIDDGLNRNNYISGIRSATTGGPPSAGSTDSNISSRIYDNDIRFVYFTGSDSAAIYNPPNNTSSSLAARRWRKRFDNVSGRFYYSTV